MSGMKLKKGDRVRVLSGKDVGKEGEITRVLPERDRVIVDGVNVAKRHQRQTASQQAGIVTKEMPIHLSNIALTDDSGKPTRVGFKINDAGRKIRFAKRSGVNIDG